MLGLLRAMLMYALLCGFAPLAAVSSASAGSSPGSGVVISDTFAGLSAQAAQHSSAESEAGKATASAVRSFSGDGLFSSDGVSDWIPVADLGPVVKLGIVLVDYEDSPEGFSLPLEAIEAGAFGSLWDPLRLQESTARWLQRNSGGQLQLTGRVAATVRVPKSACQSGAQPLADVVLPMVAAQGVSLAEFDRVVFLGETTSGCTFGMEAMVSGRYLWINGADRYRTGYLVTRELSHELGHTLGLHHASGLVCRNAAGERVVFDGGTGRVGSTRCTSFAYGDVFTVMGIGSSGYLNGFQLANLGLLDDADVITVADEPRTVTIRRMGEPADGRARFITFPGGDAGMFGVDAGPLPYLSSSWYPPTDTSGVFLRLRGWTQLYGDESVLKPNTYLLDAAPTSDYNPDQLDYGALSVGAPVVIGDTGASVELLSFTDSTATLRVIPGPRPSAPSAPSLRGYVHWQDGLAQLSFSPSPVYGLRYRLLRNGQPVWEADTVRYIGHQQTVRLTDPAPLTPGEATTYTVEVSGDLRPTVTGPPLVLTRDAGPYLGPPVFQGEPTATVTGRTIHVQARFPRVSEQATGVSLQLLRDGHVVSGSSYGISRPATVLFMDRNVPAGTHRYALRVLSGSGQTDSPSVTVTVQPADVAPPRAPQLPRLLARVSRGGSTVRVSWITQGIMPKGSMVEVRLGGRTVRTAKSFAIFNKVRIADSLVRLRVVSAKRNGPWTQLQLPPQRRS